MKEAILAVVCLAASISLALPADPVADLKKADADWAISAQNKNLDQFLSFVGDNADMAGLDGKWSHGKDGAKALWGPALADKTFKLSWTAVSADISKDGTLGYTRGTFQAEQNGKPMSGIYTTVWKKDKAGKWRVAVDIATPQTP